MPHRSQVPNKMRLLVVMIFFCGTRDLPGQSLLSFRKQDIARQTYGLVDIAFSTNARSILVSIVSSGSPVAGSTKPALWARDENGNQVRLNGELVSAPGPMSAVAAVVGDTFCYRFDGLPPGGFWKERFFEYRLYSYAAPERISVRVDDDKVLTLLSRGYGKPIVSIGAWPEASDTLSTPDMTAPARLQRAMDRPVLRFGETKTDAELFSGFLTTAAPKVCLLHESSSLPGERGSGRRIRKRTRSLIRTIQKKYPGMPVLLIAQSRRYSGLRRYPDVMIREGRGVDSLEQYLRQLLREPAGTVRTTIPRMQSREGDHYDWRERHQRILQLNTVNPPDLVVIGNSIMHYWSGIPQARFSRGADSWESLFGSREVRNLGFGWDKIENALWRVYHDELDGFRCRQLLLWIGTNNLPFDDDEAIITGLQMLVKAIRDRQPGAAVIMPGILPRRGFEDRIRALNLTIRDLVLKQGMVYVEMGHLFTSGSGAVNEQLFPDGVHPNAEGYRLIAGALQPYLQP